MTFLVGSQSRVLLITGCALAAAIGCKSTSDNNQVATSIAITPTSVAFNALNGIRQLGATVLDQNGRAMSGVNVTWSSNNPGVATISAGGLVTAVANGGTRVVATAGSLTGSDSVNVTQKAAFVSKNGGDGQSGSVATALATALSARVTDSGASPMAGINVTFNVVLGGGSLSNLSGPTNASGISTINWTLGTTAGTQQVSATVSGVPTATFTATAQPGAPALIAKQGGDGQSVGVGNAVAVAPAVKVTDSFNNPVPGVAVTFAIATGGGSITGSSAVTNASGIAAVGSWSPGSSGANTLTATATGSGIAGNPLTFTATGVMPGPPHQVVIASGNGQTGLNSYALNFAPTVLVTDSLGIPVSGAAVTFAVTGGGGSLTGGTPTTSGTGVASVGSWSVLNGANTMTATVTGAGIIGNPVTFTATGQAEAYTIQIQLLKPVTPSRQIAIDSAVAHWQRIVYGAMTPVTLNVAANSCFSGQPAINQTINDVLIMVDLDSIDGPGKILGQAGPCYVRTASNPYTILGIIQLDTADLAAIEAAGELQEVITHEMGHVLGFGTLWDQAHRWRLLVGPAGSGGLDPHFVGPQALAAFAGMGGGSYTGGQPVPVENTGGPGTADGHWRETTFITELMTGFINGGQAQSLECADHRVDGGRGIPGELRGGGIVQSDLPRACRSGTRALDSSRERHHEIADLCGGCEREDHGSVPALTTRRADAQTGRLAVKGDAGIACNPFLCSPSARLGVC